MFDPTRGEVAMPDFDRNGELPVGGYGLAIIRQLADTVSYTYRDGRNVTAVNKHCIHEDEGTL
jgi:anti-sigma regulatory factor (Ser/Thr protein kinase)